MVREGAGGPLQPICTLAREEDDGAMCVDPLDGRGALSGRRGKKLDSVGLILGDHRLQR
jgi:hypothetical protein